MSKAEYPLPDGRVVFYRHPLFVRIVHWINAVCLLLLLWLTPWFSQHVALASGLQPYTLVLAAFGIYQIRRQYLPRASAATEMRHSPVRAAGSAA